MAKSEGSYTPTPLHAPLQIYFTSTLLKAYIWMNQEQFHVSAQLRIILPTASILGPHTTTSRAGTLGRLCNMSTLHYLKKYFDPFCFHRNYFAITHKVPYFWHVSSLLPHCHGSLKVSEMDPR
jgi:hypothetical protein